MLVEISDPTLVERLKRLLPRPDLPLDVAIKSLLEKSAAWVAALAELRRIETELQVIKGQIEGLRTALEELKEARHVACGPYIAVPLAMLADGSAAAAGERDNAHNKTIFEKLRATGRQCFTYSEMREILGYRPSGQLIKRLARREEGGKTLYCLPAQ